MALEERKLALDEERLKMEAQRHNATTDILHGMSNKLEELEKKLPACTNKDTVSEKAAQFFGLKYSSSCGGSTSKY